MLQEGVGNIDTELPVLLVLNKKDLTKPGEIAKKLEWYKKFTNVDDVIPISAKFAHGVDDIKEWILSKLPLGPAYYPKDIASEHPEIFFVGEIVREKIFVQYRQEIPYACQVNVVSYKAGLLPRILFKLRYLSRRNHKEALCLDGKAIKMLAAASRLDIEDFLQKNVYLEIEIKVKENWRQDERLLKRYGYGGEIRAL